MPPGKAGQAANRDPVYRAQREEMIGYFDKAPTLPRLLAGAGYVSFQSGKWWGGDYMHGGNAVDIRRPASSLRYRWAVAGDRKLIVPDPRNAPDGRAELYDLAADPFETPNRADREPVQVARLTGLIDAWWPAEGKATD